MAKDKDAHFDDREKKSLKNENSGSEEQRQGRVTGRAIKGEVLKALRHGTHRSQREIHGE